MKTLLILFICVSHDGTHDCKQMHMLLQDLPMAACPTVAGRLAMEYVSTHENVEWRGFLCSEPPVDKKDDL